MALVHGRSRLRRLISVDSLIAPYTKVMRDANLDDVNAVIARPIDRWCVRAGATVRLPKRNLRQISIWIGC